MDQSTFLQTLPFLHYIPVSPSINIWQKHREQIVQYSQSSESSKNSNKNAKDADHSISIAGGMKSRVNCLFSNHRHVVSIEPNIHHNGAKGKPAFFRSAKMSQKNLHDGTPPSCQHDPGLVGFSAFLLPAEINSASSAASILEEDEEMVSPVKVKQQHQHDMTSPTLSTASTSMSTPQGTTACSIGGKFEHDDDDIESLLKTHLLYFMFEKNHHNHNHNHNHNHHNEVVDTNGNTTDNVNSSIKGLSKESIKDDIDLYFVDHQSMQSVEIVVAPSIQDSNNDNIKASTNTMDDNHKQENETLIKGTDGVTASTGKKLRNNHHKPTSLLIKFNSCTFRIFGKEFLLPSSNQYTRTYDNHNTNVNALMNNDKDDMSQYEQQLRHSFATIKDCILEHREKTFYFNYSNDIILSSLYSYLSHMVYPSSLHGEDQENGQIVKASTTDEDTTSKSNTTTSDREHNNSNDTFESHSAEDKEEQKIITGMTKEALLKKSSSQTSVSSSSNTSHRKISKNGNVNINNSTNAIININRERKRKRKSYEKSWNALEKIHSIVNGSTKVDGLENNKQFVSLLETSAVELRKSYIIDDEIAFDQENGSNGNTNNVFLSRETNQRELDAKVSKIQHSIDETIQRIFPSTTGRRSKSSKKAKHNATATEEEIERHLKNYRRTIAAQHMMAFMPSR